MPVKNTAKFLIECLDSIIHQTETNWELIAIDDHSTDESLAILSDYAKQDPRIKVFQNSGKGIIDALRLAFSKSQGELITRMDSDDKMAETKLTFMKSILEENGQKTLAIGLVKYFSNESLADGYKRYENWLNTLALAEHNFTEIYKECVIPSPCWMVYRSDLQVVNGFEPNVYPEDYDLCFRFYKYGFQVKTCPHILHYWRDYSNRTSRTDDNYADNRFLDLKVHYFLEVDRKKDLPLLLLGAGKKGKMIAKKLLAQGISFEWLTDNPKKIGKDIYGVVLKKEDWLSTTPKSQIILAIASPKDQKNIQNRLKNLPNEAFWFC